MKALKILLTAVLLTILSVGCISNNKIYHETKAVQMQVAGVSRQLAKLDSTYNAQQLTKYRYEIKAIDDRYKKGFSSDSALLHHFKLLGRPGHPR